MVYKCIKNIYFQKNKFSHGTILICADYYLVDAGLSKTCGNRMGVANWAKALTMSINCPRAEARGN
jgi:hypothetical protein